MNKAVWRYNEHGHLEVWDVTHLGESTDRESDLYIQSDIEIESFFESFGINFSEINIGDSGEVEDCC